jgi:hypothetical protein
VVELQEILISEYYREEVAYSEQKFKKAVYNDIFAKNFYEILMNPFFLSKQEVPSYEENPHLKKLSTNLSANQIQTSMTLEGFRRRPRNKRACCGLFDAADQDEGPPLIDSFHCSLKDGLVLIRGNLFLIQVR